MGESDRELVEVVDRNGAVQQVVPRHEMRERRLRHRATFIVVVDPTDRILIHQRSPDKDVWPLRWDIAAGGCSAVGEPWLEGAQRELAEELGIVADLTRIGDGIYEDDDVAVLGVVYAARFDGEVAFTDGEVVDARWVSLDELTSLRRSTSFCPDSIALALGPVCRWVAEQQSECQGSSSD